MFGKHRYREKHSPGPFVRLMVKLIVMLLIFGAGGVTGMFYGLNLAFSKMREHAVHMAELPDTIIPRLADQLELTADQLPEFDAIFRQKHAEITKTVGANAVRVHELFYEMGKEIVALLDKKQAAKFREIHRKLCSVFLPPIPLGTKGAEHHCSDL